jgi:curved DNA-binding protein CbpA
MTDKETSAKAAYDLLEDLWRRGEYDHQDDSSGVQIGENEWVDIHRLVGASGRYGHMDEYHAVLWSSHGGHTEQPIIWAGHYGAPDNPTYDGKGSPGARDYLLAAFRAASHGWEPEKPTQTEH